MTAFRLKAGGGANFDNYAEKDLGADYDELYIQFALICPTAFLDIFGPLGAHSTSGYFYGILDNGAAFVEGLLSHFDGGVGGSEVSWRTDNEFANFGGPVVADTTHCVQIHLVASTDTENVRIDGVDYPQTVSFSGNPLRTLRLGYFFGFAETNEFVLLGDVKVGTTGYGSSDVFADNFASGDLSNWDSSTGDAVVEAGPCSCGAGAAAKLGISAEPGDACAGATLDPLVVLIQDADGNTVTGSTAAVTVAIGTNPGGGTLSGTLTVNAVAGVATFSDLSISAAGVGYTLHATSAGLTAADTGPFTIFTAAPNATCAGAIAITGTTGCVNGANDVCAGTPAGGDALEDWWGDTMGNVLFYRYVAPADGYIQFTLDRPGGSSFTKMVGGVFHDACGNPITGDVVLDTPTYNEAFDGAPPGLFGTPVSASDVVYVEVATDLDEGGAPGAFELCWQLRTVSYLDCIDQAEKHGVEFPIPTVGSAALVTSLGSWYEQTADGRHWFGYSYRTAIVGDTATFEARVAVSPTGAAGSWVDTVVHTAVNDESVDTNESLNAGPFLVTDGANMWCIVGVRGGVGHTYIPPLASFWQEEQFPNYLIHWWNGSSWDYLGMMESLGDATLDTGHHGEGAGPLFSASPNEPGVLYAGFGEQGNLYGRFVLTKWDTAGQLWTNDVFTSVSPADVVLGQWSRLWNQNGPPLLFIAFQTTGETGDPTYGTDYIGAPVELYGVNPGSGALTHLQALPLEGGSSGFISQFFGAPSLSAAFTDLDSIQKYYVAVRQRLSLADAQNYVYVYKVPVDGSAPFEYFDGDPAKAFYLSFDTADGLPWQNVFVDPDNVWIPQFGQSFDQFDRLCFEAWQPDAVPNVAVDGFFSPTTTYQAINTTRIGQSFYGFGLYQKNPSGADWSMFVYKADIHRSCFCELGPVVVIGGGAAPINVRYRIDS